MSVGLMLGFVRFESPGYLLLLALLPLLAVLSIRSLAKKMGTPILTAQQGGVKADQVIEDDELHRKIAAGMRVPVDYIDLIKPGGDDDG